MLDEIPNDSEWENKFCCCVFLLQKVCVRLRLGTHDLMTGVFANIDGRVRIDKSYEFPFRGEQFIM